MLSATPGFEINRNRGGQVLDGGPHRFEKRDFLCRLAPADRSFSQIEEVAEDRLLANHAGVEGLNDVASFGASAGPGIDIDARATHHSVVGLAHVRPESAQWWRKGAIAPCSKAACRMSTRPG